jgi:RNA polymerase sigma-70 factor, ECF subfamily
VNTLSDALATDVEAGFIQLVERMRDGIYALALGLCGSPHDAEDVAQDALVRAYRALRTYSPARRRALHLKAWLAKIALNVWRNRIRGAKRERVELSDEWAADDADAPEARAERGDAARRLRRLLSTLPDRYRVALVLRHAYDLPYAQAARALGMPVGTLKANVHRGTRMLRAAYERQFGKDDR